MKKFFWSIIGLMATLIIGIGISAAYLWHTSASYKIAGVPVLNYHQINDVMFSPLTMEVAHFEQQMAYLSENGYHSITMTQLYEHLTEGKPLPDKPVLITFDDGYTDNYVNAFPILKKYHLTATIFMIGDAIGQDRFMTKEQLIELQKAGIDIEAHTYAHKPLTTFTPEQIKEDLQKSRKVLEELLGREIHYLAYPQGFYNDTVEHIAKENGFYLAFTVSPGNVHKDDDFFALPRLAIFEGDDAQQSLILRLHYPEIAAYLWQLRDDLYEQGHEQLADMVPLF